MSVLARLALAISLVITGIVASSTPAHAGEKRYWNNKNESPYYKGYARGGLKVDFLSGRAIDVEGFIEDMCPADGRSAIISFRVLLNGTPTSALPSFADKNKCGNGRRYFDPPPYRTLKHSGTKITALVAYICQVDYDTETPYVDRCAKQYFDNWRVG